MESLRLQKTTKITESNLWLNHVNQIMALLTVPLPRAVHYQCFLTLSIKKFFWWRVHLQNPLPFLWRISEVSYLPKAHSIQWGTIPFYRRVNMLAPWLAKAQGTDLLYPSYIAKTTAKSPSALWRCNLKWGRLFWEKCLFFSLLCVLLQLFLVPIHNRLGPALKHDACKWILVCLPLIWPGGDGS